MLNTNENSWGNTLACFLAEFDEVIVTTLISVECKVIASSQLT